MFVLNVILFMFSVVDVLGLYWYLYQYMLWNDVIGEIYVNSGIYGDVYVVDLFDYRGIIFELFRYFKNIYICIWVKIKKSEGDEVCIFYYMFLI